MKTFSDGLHSSVLDNLIEERNLRAKKFPLKPLLSLYLKFRRQDKSYVECMELLKPLFVWLSPCEASPNSQYKYSSLLYNYEQLGLATWTGCTVREVQVTLLELIQND